MSCNVPLLVLDATTMYDEYSNGRIIYESMRPKKLLSTSVPYWSDKCGIKITALEELPAAIDDMVTAYFGYRPREFVVETLSPGVCMDRILTYFDLHV
jgi:hypothetical protein